MTDPPATDETGASRARPIGEQRVSVLLGDRLCVTCGFNLHGQTIVREPHYGMLAVRCPECSTLASLQEYPVLGRWAARIGLLLALAWLFVVLLLSFLTGLTFYGASEAIAAQATRPAARQLGEAFRAYALAHQEPAGSGTVYAQDMSWTITNEEPAYIWIEPGWLGGQDIDALTRGGRINWRALAAATPLALAGAAWGVVWSVVLLHRRLRARVIITGAIVVIAAAMLAINHALPATGAGGVLGPLGLYSYGWGWGVPAATIAAKAYGLPVAFAAAAIGFGAMVVGLALGRKIARAMVRMLLPPHLRGPLAMLWLVDGLPPPPTRGEFWVRG